MTNSSLFRITNLKGLRALNGHNIIYHTFSRNNHWSKYSYVCGTSSEPLKPYTIGGIFNDAVQQTPDRDFLVSCHENKRFTFAAMDSEVDKLCKSFNAIGLKHGDRVGIWMPNCAFYYLAIIATARLGLILVNVNPAYQSDELKHSLTLAEVKCLVTIEKFKTQNYPEILEKVDPDIWKRPPNTPVKSKILPTLESVIFYSENRINGAYNLQTFLDLGFNTDYNIPKIQPDEGCNIQFTSGTTGKPKAALLNHFALINNAYFIMKRLEIYDDTKEGKLHKFCCPMPLFHAFALSIAVVAPMVTKSTVYLPSAHFDPKATVEVLTKEKCTFIFGTPTVYVDTMSVFEKLPPEQQKNNMKIAISGGAPCSPNLMIKFKNMFPRAKILSLFGMTETSPCTFQNFSNDSDERIMSTMGFIQDHVEAKVIDTNGNMVPFGTPGELLIRGYLKMNGYFNDEEKTKETIDSNGWLHTGDQFVLFEDGYGNHVGRLKEMIIRGGENLFPKEIEYFLESHPLISQVQVYGIPDERMGEEVCASVILKEGATVTEADIKAYSKGKIAHFKIPKYIFIEKDAFPMTASGKVQKYRLREMAIQRISSLT
ncbi:acyl-CoA synthetase family member 2, mitochondrial-like isoform X1 [Rhopalosiphum maidis]|uniref:acyl-CoA synthetase family member 2, mitochondrial-like isoform X1 n=1 Tax=Rhopalosiphum maidis TaxID=43146 RepID=UPI000EFF92DA|nr:acyl-CoA synthetase family member 2, mitochondrial-like isoform X1 [Rhopalosiphum maidis]XP_026809192.1 acyl-CoA synthetase family member 2, mitochondrial-like isoform X1 [Rhopalosiphum maidis]XP_026809193.1 acyl-CoA synthetase family member 2, mitochondrial-like isoform X1 [Rhopalosiphum maidis]